VTFTEIGAFTPEDARMVLQVCRQVQQSGILSPAYVDRIVRRLPRSIGGDGGEGAIFVTPEDGIPAMTSTGTTLTFGSALCFRVTVGGDLTGTIESDTSTVYNSVSGAIPGGVTVQAKKIKGRWFADVVDCQAVVDYSEENPDPLFDGEDPFNEDIGL
jgi:hypothetical protein